MTENELSRRRRRIPWWGKALLIFGGVLCVLAAAWTGWLLYAQAQLRAEIEAIRARGEPVRLIDLKPPPLPPDKDAAVFLRQAVQRFEADVKPLLDELDGNMEADGYRYYDWTALADYPELRRDYGRQLEEILTAAGPALALVRKARGLGSYDCGIDYSGSAAEFDFLVVGYSGKRHLAKLLHLAAMAARERGDEMEAVACIRGILTVANSVGQEPFLIAMLVALAIEGLTVGGVEDIAPSLQVGGEEPGASLEQVQELIAALLDEKRQKNRIAWAFLSERVYGYEMCEKARRGRCPEGLGNPVVDKGLLRMVFKPVLIADEARLIRYYQPLIEALRQDDYPSVQRELPPSRLARGWWQSLMHPFDYSALVPGFSLVPMLHFRSVASCRMAGTALAMRLYEIDHGKRPAKLTDLVPDYLPAVPEDPFDPKGGAIRRGAWDGHELLYSVDINGTDEGGQDEPDPNYPTAYSGPDDYDLPFFLNGDRPREPLEKSEQTTGPRPGTGGPLPPLPGLPPTPEHP